MSVIAEFKEFAMKGNVVDLAVGVVIGGAFGKIVSALVDKVLMPPLGLALGGVNFSDLGLVLKEAADAKDNVVFGYGAFLQSCLDFMIIAFALFMIVKLMNRMKREAPAPPPAPAEPPAQEKLLAEIRDLLRKA